MGPVVAVVVQALGQQPGVLGLVVDAAHQRVFDADAPLGRQEVVVRGVEHLCSVEPFVHRHQLVAQLVARGVQGDGEPDGDALLGESADAGHHAHRGHRDVARGDAEPLRRHRADLPNGAQHGPVVAHRLAHAHEHDVAEPARPAGNVAVPHGLGRHTHLFDDLAGRHIAGQTEFAGGAERAAHAAADLAGDAQGGAVGVPHEHGFDQRTVEQTPQRLDGHALIRHLARDLGDQGRKERRCGLIPLGRRKIGELRGVDIEMPVIMVGQLLDAELRQPQLPRPGDALLGRHIGEMDRRFASSGMVLGQHIPERPGGAARRDAGFRHVLQLCHIHPSPLLLAYRYLTYQ